MSGPKCATFYVEDNHALASARLEAARQAAQDARARLLVVDAEAEAVAHRCGVAIALPEGAAPAQLTGSGSVEEFEWYVAEAQGAIARLRAEMDRAEAVSRLRELIWAAPAGSGEVADWSEQLRCRARTAGDTADGRPSEVDQRRDRIGRIVARLAGGIIPDELRVIDELVREILGSASLHQAESLEADLRLRVQRANEGVQRRVHEVVTANRLLAELRGLAGDKVAALRGELEAIRDGRTTASASALAERVAETRRKTERTADEAYAARVLREELARLGYGVGEEFSTLCVEGGEAVVRRPDRPGYGVEMRVDPRRGVLDIEVVRVDDSIALRPSESAALDRDAEERWCRDFDDLRSTLRRRGIGGRVVRRTPPGAQPLRAIPLTATAPRRAERLTRERRL